jgi:hypothetical protein
MAITRPWTCHMPLVSTLTACRYIIPLFKSRPPGLQPPIRGKETKQSNKRSAYVLVQSNKSRYRSVPHKATFRRIRRTGKLHLQWQVVKPVPTPFVPGRDRRREEINKNSSKSDPVSVSRLPNPCSNDHHFRSSYLGVGLCRNNQGRASAHELASMAASPAGMVRSLW